MRFSDGVTSVQLRITGYESNRGLPLSDDPDGDCRPSPDWLTVEASVSGAAPRKVFGEVSLTTEEARALLQWLRAVSDGRIVPTGPWEPSEALLHFTEPDLAVRVLARDTETVTTRWYFYHPDAPSGSAEDLVFHNVHPVDVAVPRGDFDAEADSWESDVQRFPDR